MKNITFVCAILTVSLVFCRTLAGNTSPKSELRKDRTGKYVLLPQPQQIQYLSGTHKLKPQRFIYLDMASSDRLLDTGRIVQSSLAQVGPKWQLTAARNPAAPEYIGCAITLNPTQIPQPQGYRLTIDENQIRITAHDAAGAFYAAQTLRQICKQSSIAQQLSCLDINDWPDFPNRGVMLDISRDKVPTMETLYDLIELLCQWKINQFQLYTEHTFAYSNHRTVWQDASPMTGEEILALDAFCRGRYVELAPNQNSFGHMNRWLKHDRYKHLAECPDGCQTSWGRMQNFTLCPVEPGSIELISEMFDELLPHFTSRQINIGCDETVELGQGRSKQLCEEKGKGRVYLDFLLKIHQQVRKHGRTMQFWGDIILDHPELISELPDNIIAMVWGYEATHPFAKQCAQFAASGVPFYVCPGTSSWNSIAGRTENALANLLNAAENGSAHGAIGYLNTNWGDNGHWQPLPVCYLGYAYGAAVSWAGQTNRDIDLPQALDLHAFNDKAATMGQLVYDLGNAYKVPDVFLSNQSILFHILQNPTSPIREGRYANLTIDNLTKTRNYIDEVIQPLYQTRIDRADAQLIIDEISNAANLLRHACSLAIARLQTQDGKISDIPQDVRKKLTGDLEKIISEHKRLWLLRNRPGGLPDSAARMDRLLKLYYEN